MEVRFSVPRSSVKVGSEVECLREVVVKYTLASKTRYVMNK